MAAPGGWLVDTAGVYGRVFRRGAALAARNWQLAGVIAASLEVLDLGLPWLARLGIVGGLLVTLAMTACTSAALALAGEIVRGGRIKWGGVPAAFGTFLGDLLTLGFIVWGLQLVAGLALAPFPFLLIVFGLAALVFLNAVPELVYLGRQPPAALLVASYRFIGENWIEWFPANVLLLGLLWVTMQIPDGFGDVMGTMAWSAALSYALVVRGLLFLELIVSSRRAREFRRLAG